VSCICSDILTTPAECSRVPGQKPLGRTTPNSVRFRVSERNSVTHCRHTETADGLPKPVETIDADGIKTVVEYKINEAGKKVKVSLPSLSLGFFESDPLLLQVTRRIKRTLVKQSVNHAVAERKSWAKFGLEKGKKPGPDSGTTTIGEAIRIKMSAGNKASVRNTLPSRYAAAG
jgi:hypothetical protein